MQFIFSLLFAGLLVAAQSSWKLAVDGHAALFSGQEVSVAKVFGFIFAPLTLLGVALYVIATVLYMFLLSRYQFSFLQAMAIPLTLMLSTVVAITFFGDRLSLVNFIGIGVIVVGIMLVTMR